MEITGIESSQIGVLLIDAQPAFWDYAFPDADHRKESIMVRLEHLLMLADWMELPLIATFEDPVSENGELPDRLEAVFPAAGQRFTKKTFNCTLEWTIQEAIKRLPVKQFAVAGAETDVCIMQSVLGLLRMGYQVFLLEDCLFTTEAHPGPALRLVRHLFPSVSVYAHRAYQMPIPETILQSLARQRTGRRTYCA